MEIMVGLNSLALLSVSFHMPDDPGRRAVFRQCFHNAIPIGLFFNSLAQIHTIIIDHYYLLEHFGYISVTHAVVSFVS